MHDENEALGKELHRQLSYADPGDDLGEWAELGECERSFYRVAANNFLVRAADEIDRWKERRAEE